MNSLSCHLGVALGATGSCFGLIPSIVSSESTAGLAPSLPLMTARHPVYSPSCLGRVAVRERGVRDGSTPDQCHSFLMTFPHTHTQRVTRLQGWPQMVKGRFPPQSHRHKPGPRLSPSQTAASPNVCVLHFLSGFPLRLCWFFCSMRAMTDAAEPEKPESQVDTAQCL